jgi:hypothetical protein
MPKFAFDVYTMPMAQNGLKLYCTDEQKVPFRDVQTQRGYLQNKWQNLVFAMNAGIYFSHFKLKISHKNKLLYVLTMAKTMILRAIRTLFEKKAQ